ncbi:alpha/beta fold hydrolase [Micromonospora sp. CB01531]|uniref:alpha/beta fold hydrolase n=1 Tax=Micromonospora sp. CB01531 TaxID=1718947 RepID=UPI00093CC843|nr:alpha/beta hydrolase [Micromonospora sp. CB01531]OKI47499.1 alpha/beta hydrolase [Micromonospora sp. CB01531]
MNGFRFTLRRARTLLAAAAIALSLAMVGSAGAAAEVAPSVNNEPVKRKPTVVLVHGGFADATISWTDVTDRLQKRGYPVIAPANPLRSLGTDSAYIASVLRSINGPIILVGHSYGGAVITNAAAGNPNVKALVYVAAFVPDTGEALGELIDKYPGSEIQAALNPVPYPNPDGTTGTDLYLQADKLRQVFAADLPTSTTKVMAVTQRPFNAACFTDHTQAAAWHTIPSWGLIATQDKAIPPALQRYEYQRAGSRTVQVAASHVAMISHPDVVTDLIMSAANATS